MTKLKIDLNNGLFEVEGEESFVKSIYQDYKDHILSNDFIPPSAPPTPEPEKKTSGKKTSKGKSTPSKSGNKRKESYQVVKDLDLSSKGGKQDLKSFYAAKKPGNGMEKNAVFVYYLQRIANVNGINADHVYSCYKNVGEKVPGALRQSLIDTSSRKGTIDTKSMDNITITTQGENLVELDLPPKEKE